jgi:hypothetical protein
VLDWILYGLKTQDILVFEPIVASQGLFYAFYIEGGQSLDKETYLQHLNARLASAPHCDGITREGSSSLLVWTSGWSPPWQMEEICYIECATVMPPRESSTAAFMLFSHNGHWGIHGMYQNTPENYYFIEPLPPIAPCDTPYDELVDYDLVIRGYTPGDVCPGAPPQRMQIDKRGYVCTQKDRVALRTEPGRGYDVLKYLDPGTTFLVVNGAVCADNWSWWEVRLDDGFVGWIAEGGDNVDPYFICPQP